MTEPRYFLLRNGATFGPYSLKRLEAMLHAREIDLNGICLAENGSQIQRIKELFPEFLASHPVEEPRQETDEEEDFGAALEQASENVEDQPIDSTQEEGDEPSTEEVDWDDGEWLAEDEEDEFDDDGYSEKESGLGDDPELDPDKVLLILHPSILSYTKLLITLAGLLSLGVLFYMMPQTLPGRHLFQRLSLLAVFFGICVFILILFLRQFDVCVVTRSRVETIRGVFAKSSKEVRIDDIRRIDVEKPGILGFLGVGTVLFSSAGTGGFDIDFRHIWRAHRVKRLVRQVRKTPRATRQNLLKIFRRG